MGLCVPLIQPEPPRICEGRFTLTSGAPDDVIGASGTSLYFAPYKGNRVALLDGVRPRLVTFTQQTLTVQNSYFRLMDVFGYLSSGALACEQLAWDSAGQTTGSITGATNALPVVVTSNSHGLSNGDYVGVRAIAGNTAPNDHIWKVANVTANTFELEFCTGNGAYSSGGTWYKVPAARTTGIVLNGTGMEGSYTKSGDPTRLYLGTYGTLATAGTVTDDTTARCVFSYHHRVVGNVQGSISDSHTYTSATTRLFNALPTARGHFVCGVSDQYFPIFGSSNPNSGAGTISIASLQNGVLVNIQNSSATTFQAGSGVGMRARIGLNWIDITESGAASFAASNAFWYGMYPH